MTTEECIELARLMERVSPPRSAGSFEIRRVARQLLSYLRDEMTDTKDPGVQEYLARMYHLVIEAAAGPKKSLDSGR